MSMSSRNPYIHFVLRWYWLLALGLIVALGATHYALSKRVPLYRSTATVQIGRAIEQKDPNQDELAITDRLASAYAELARRDPVLSAVRDTLGLPLQPDDLRARLLVSPVPRTQLVDIMVVDEIPERAAAIANEIARQLVLQSPNNTPEDATQEFIQAQLIDLQQKITTTQAEIAQLQDDMAAMTSAADVAEAQQRLTTLQAQVDSWQQSYANLVRTVEPSTTNIVSIVSEATAAATPIPTSTTLYYGLAAVIGIGFTTLLGLGLNMLNTVIQRPTDLAELQEQIPTVSVPRYRVPADGTPVALGAPDSSPAAAYRVLRNAIQAHIPNYPQLTIAVTSARTGEGKTTTALNLAVALANSGRRVVLVDANMRNPELSLLLGLDGRPGFSDILSDGMRFVHALYPSKHPSLFLLPAGRAVANYADVLSSVRLREAIERLSKGADAVILDGPAIQEEQDALLLARAANVVLVIVEARRTRFDELQRTLAELDAQDAVVTVVLNKTRQARMLVTRLPWSREARAARRGARRRAQRRPGGLAATGEHTQLDAAKSLATPGSG